MYYVLGNTLSDCYPAVKSTRERDMEGEKRFCSRVKLLCIFSGWQASEKCNILDTLICLLNKILNYSVPVSLMLLFSHDKNSAPESTSVSFFNWNMIFFFLSSSIFNKTILKNKFYRLPTEQGFGASVSAVFLNPTAYTQSNIQGNKCMILCKFAHEFAFSLFPLFLSFILCFSWGKLQHKLSK